MAKKNKFDYVDDDSNVEEDVEVKDNSCVEDLENSTNVSKIEDDFNALKNELEGSKDQLLRLQAEFDNYRRRSEQEKIRIIKNATESLIESQLVILDNFELALKNIDNKDSLYVGLKAIYDEFLKTLINQGLETVGVVGEKFDSNFHHAVIAEEIEGTEPEFVVEILRTGYKLNDKLIRPAMVKVSK